jgi:hypothetical protein
MRRQSSDSPSQDVCQLAERDFHAGVSLYPGTEVTCVPTHETPQLSGDLEVNAFGFRFSHPILIIEMFTLAVLARIGAHAFSSLSE